MMTTRPPARPVLMMMLMKAMLLLLDGDERISQSTFSPVGYLLEAGTVKKRISSEIRTPVYPACGAPLCPLRYARSVAKRQDFSL